MKIERSFQPDLTRYDFDNQLLAKGYLQVDTEQDASYYGNWVNLKTRRFVQFAEGDVTVIDFASNEEMTDYLRNVYQLLHIDAGLRNRDQVLKLAEDLGISEIMA